MRMNGIELFGNKVKAMYKGIDRDFDECRRRLSANYIYNIKIYKNKIDTPLVIEIDGINDHLYYTTLEALLKDWVIQYDEEEIEETNYDKPKVITLCGSSKYRDKFYEVQRSLVLQGYIVLSLDFFIKAESKDNVEILKLRNDLKEYNLTVPAIEDFLKSNYFDIEYPSIEHLKRIHNAKIDMSDGIFVINVENYIGDNTLDEIECAHSKGKKVFYLSKYPDMIIPNEVWL